MSPTKPACLLLALLALSSRGYGQLPLPPTTQPAPFVRAGHAGDAAPTNLRAAMNELLDVIFNLKGEAIDPAYASQTLKDLAFFERDVAICKLHYPPSLNRLSGADKADEADSYRSMMSDLLRTGLDMEEAVADGKAEDIKRLLKRVDEIEADGHAEFVPP
jgi:hypothetical protein